MTDEPPLSNFKPHPIDDATYAAMGRIVRACAELEDMLTLFICNLAEVSEGRAMVLLGRSSFSTRKNIALYLAKMRDDDALKAYNRIFEGSVKNATKCRNSIAHGVYLGMNNSGELGFLTDDTVDPEGGAAVKLVQCYSSQTLKDIARLAELHLPLIEQILKIETLRGRRQGQSLQRHRKGQPQQKQPSKRKPPPQS